MPLIDMDQTPPAAKFYYEIIDYDMGIISLLFTVNATDALSGMDRVEFYLNDVLQKIALGSGPIYQWGFTYHGGLNLVVRADGNDIAGNMDSDEIRDPKVTNYQNTQQQSQSRTSSYCLNKPLQRLFVIPGGFR